MAAVRTLLEFLVLLQESPCRLHVRGETRRREARRRRLHLVGKLQQEHQDGKTTTKHKFIVSSLSTLSLATTFTCQLLQSAKGWTINCLGLQQRSSVFL